MRMNNLADQPKEFSELIDEHRPHEAFVFFLEQVGNKSWPQLSTPELAMLDTLCQHTLPELREHYTLWLVHHPDLLHRMLDLLTEALAVNYRSPATVDHIAWLRCFLAIEEALAGRLERVHEELCLVRGGQETDSVPKPNGKLRQQIQSIELTERTSVEFLRQFFASYLEFLRRVGQHELANHLDSRIGRLLGHIARDETRPGVVHALFYDKIRAVGHSRFVHVSMERLPCDGVEARSGESIEYARKKEGIIDLAMQEAATYARQTVDAYLKRIGYPDGLEERLIRWEIASLEGDAVDLDRQFQGGSVALPLAVAIVSEYLAKPIPNDITFTGSFTEACIANGRILPVDGILEKVEHAVVSGCNLVHIPAPNLVELDAKPALRNLVSEHDARIVAAETLDQVCEKLFPPEGSGRLLDTIKDTGINVMQILHPASSPEKHAFVRPTHERYRIHIIVCCILTAALMFLECWRVYEAFAPSYPSVVAWSKIFLSTAIVLIGMGVSFALPAACLRHRKAWSWYVSIALLGVCFGMAAFLVGSMLPDFTGISSLYNAPPVAGLLKDLFIMWGFAWAIAAGTFNAVAALEDLIAKRQFVTARTCLRWGSPLEARMPIMCIHFPWKWGVLVIGVVVGYLIKAELNYYTTLDTGTPAGYWEVLLGIVRDLLFITAIGEVMVFYKVAVARIRRSLS